MDFSAHESEYKLVCHLLNNFDNDREVFSKLTKLDFQCPILGEIYESMKRVYDEGITRKPEIYLKLVDAAQMVGTCIAKMGNQGVNLHNAEAHALIIKEKAVQRRLLEAARIEEQNKTSHFEDELEDFCDYLEETAEEMRNLDFTKEYSKQILSTMNKQMKRLISLQQV